MSHFYGTLNGSRGEATRCGTKQSGMCVIAAGWGGAVRVRLWHDSEAGVDRFEVEQVPWRGNGVARGLARGIIGWESH